MSAEIRAAQACDFVDELPPLRVSPWHPRCQDKLSIADRGLQRTAVHLDEVASYGEAKTRARGSARAGAIPSIEPFEEPGKLVWLHVWRRIRYFDGHLSAAIFVDEGSDPDFAARRRELAGVVQQVLQRPLQVSERLLR